MDNENKSKHMLRIREKTIDAARTYKKIDGLVNWTRAEHIDSKSDSGNLREIYLTSLCKWRVEHT